MLPKLEFGFLGPQYQLRQKLTEKKLRDLASQGVPIRRMAKLLDEAPTTVDRFLKRYGIAHPRQVGRPTG
jgi:IS30 family transposase